MFSYFSIENFRSIKNESTLNLSVSGVGNHLPHHIYSVDASSSGVLRSAGIYGANASGKSNVLLAFEALKYMAVRCGDLKDGERIRCYEPYALSLETKNAPVKFEVEFYTDSNTRFLYRVEFERDEVTYESLDYYPSRVKANLFTRHGGDGWDDIKFGGHYKGGIKKIPLFKNNTYLSKAGNNAASPDIIKEVYNFFRFGVKHIGLNENIRISSFGNKEDVVNDVSKALCLIDTGVTGISIKNVEVNVEFIEFLQDVPADVREIIEDEHSVRYMFSHASEDGQDVSFPKEIESEGTQKLFEIIPLLKQAFSKRMVVVVDELDNSLHPHIADLIIRLFNDDKVNRVGSQIIFSTHNIQIMTPEKMRRDQIWFCEKNRGASILYSLDDFDKKKVKATTSYASWYNEGRFGGVPRFNYVKLASFFAGSDFVSEISDYDFSDFFED